MRDPAPKPAGRSAGPRTVTRRHNATLATAMLAATLAVTCADEAVEPEPSTPTAIAVSPISATFQALADTVRLTATVRNQHRQVMSDVAIMWTSSEPSTVGVDGSGLVTAVGNGIAEVTARAGSASGTATITVEQVPVNVTLDPDSLVFARVGDTARVEAEFVDANGHTIPDSEVQWKSADPLVATVDTSGLVTAVANGHATVSAAAGAVLGKATVTVGRADSVALSPPGDTISPGDTLRLAATAFDEYGNEMGPTRFSWTSSDVSVVSVDKSGLVTAEAEGRATVTANLAGARATAPITVWSKDRIALVALYNATDGPNWLNNGNWLTDARLSRWYGVLTDERGRVGRLELTGNRLSGKIPPELGGAAVTVADTSETLAFLQALVLDNNDLTGSIPPELGNLSALQGLHLAINNLTGSVPPELGNLLNLTDLVVAGNNLGGPIPADLGNLSKLERLDLAHNDLGGPIPAELGNLGGLVVLRLNENYSLSGPLPRTLTNLTRLEGFQWHGNDRALCAPGTSEFVSWLDGIAIHNAGRFCNASDRATLVRLFDTTGGRRWAEARGWSTPQLLERWHGVTVDSLGLVTAVDLSDNGLSGSFSSDVAKLRELRSINISGNPLSGRLPLSLTSLDLDEFAYGRTALCEPTDEAFRGWLIGIAAHQGTGTECPPMTDRDVLMRLYEATGGPSWHGRNWLTDLPLSAWEGVTVDYKGRVDTLSLPGRGFSGVIPPELGSLSGLSYLSLAYNDLSGPIPTELAHLSNLRGLVLSHNDLSGAIPAELDALDSLQILRLEGNSLSGSIPGELGELANLRELHVGQNVLSGAIPSELGALASLRMLDLGANRLVGSVPPSFGKLANLVDLVLARNDQLAGPLPHELAELRLQQFFTQGTDLCAPSDGRFQAWLRMIVEEWVASCGAASAYLVQAVQSRTKPVPLVAGEGALLRVFVTGKQETSEVIPAMVARFYLDGIERHIVEIPTGTSRIPVDVEEGMLSQSANAEIPSHILEPGLEVVVEIDPGGVVDASLGVPRRIPQEGRLAIEVREMPVLDLKVIPFVWTSGDSAIIGLVESMAADPEGHELLEYTRVLLPVGDIDVTAHAPVATASNNAFDLAAQTWAISVLEGGGGHYMGMMSSMSGPAGLAGWGGRYSVSKPSSYVIAHELGHNMGLWHAPCGGASATDPSFPYPDGAIGAWGYDFRRGLLVPVWWRDLMSACGPAWTSDYHFTNALAHRLSDEGASAAALAAAPTRSLLLWGGTDATGTPFLHPAFVADAPPTLPDSAGAYTVTGRDGRGGELFSLNFPMPEVPDGDGSSSFVFALPVRQEWEATLTTITLSGPDGTFTLDGDTDRPMAILRDPITGQVRGFLRDLPPQTQAAMDAAERAVAPGLQVLFSRGIPDATEWRR